MRCDIILEDESGNLIQRISFDENPYLPKGEILNHYNTEYVVVSRQTEVFQNSRGEYVLITVIEARSGKE